MKVVVINGSPKGAYSITLQSCLYLKKLFPDCAFELLHVGKTIQKLEGDVSSALAALQAAELILFAYPVYTFLAPYQLHRFLELVRESGVSLRGKVATQLTTSKHFYDVTAHRYIEDTCADLGLHYIRGLSQDMDDLTKPEGQQDLVKFFKYVRFCMEQQLFEQPSVTAPSAPRAYQRSLSPCLRKVGKETVIVADLRQGDEALQAMIDDFCAAYPYPTRLVNIREFPFIGGCLGCFHCAADGKCVYKDGFDSFLRDKIQRADSIVLAFTVRDHSMGARFKLYDDRQFCNGHRTVTMGMPMGYIVCGELEGEENLRTVIAARSEVGQNTLCGIASDAQGIQSMAQRMAYALENAYVIPRNFYGVGGMKIFRDLIYLMRGLMRADHKFYKKHGVYDFPQKQRGRMLLMTLAGAAMNKPTIRKKLGNKLNEGMLAPYKKVLDGIDNKK